MRGVPFSLRDVVSVMLIVSLSSFLPPGNSPKLDISMLEESNITLSGLDVLGVILQLVGKSDGAGVDPNIDLVSEVAEPEGAGVMKLLLIDLALDCLLLFYLESSLALPGVVVTRIWNPIKSTIRDTDSIRGRPLSSDLDFSWIINKVLSDESCGLEKLLFIVFSELLLDELSLSRSSVGDQLVVILRCYDGVVRAATFICQLLLPLHVNIINQVLEGGDVGDAGRPVLEVVVEDQVGPEENVGRVGARGEHALEGGVRSTETGVELVEGLELDGVDGEPVFKLVNNLGKDVVVPAADEQIDISTNAVRNTAALQSKITFPVLVDLVHGVLGVDDWELSTDLVQSDAPEHLMGVVSPLEVDDPLTATLHLQIAGDSHCVRAGVDESSSDLLPGDSRLSDAVRSSTVENVSSFLVLP